MSWEINVKSCKNAARNIVYMFQYAYLLIPRVFKPSSFLVNCNRVVWYSSRVSNSLLWRYAYAYSVQCNKVKGGNIKFSYLVYIGNCMILLYKTKKINLLLRSLTLFENFINIFVSNIKVAQYACCCHISWIQGI